MVKARVLKAPEIEQAPQTLTGAQMDQILDAAHTARDRLLLTVLVEAGLRIGEALGLRREDMHLLPDSTHLGCRTRGAHLHVRPRQNNENGARAKAADTARCPSLRTPFTGTASIWPSGKTFPERQAVTTYS